MTWEWTQKSYPQAPPSLQKPPPPQTGQCPGTSSVHSRTVQGAGPGRTAMVPRGPFPGVASGMSRTPLRGPELGSGRNVPSAPTLSGQGEVVWGPICVQRRGGAFCPHPSFSLWSQATSWGCGWYRWGRAHWGVGGLQGSGPEGSSGACMRRKTRWGDSGGSQIRQTVEEPLLSPVLP